MNDLTQKSLFTEEFYLTDGGLETTLIFHQDIELPYFAAFQLVMHPEGRNALKKYYQPYLEIARHFKLPFILETPTWRANTDWGLKLNYSVEKLMEINRRAVQFVRELSLAEVGHNKVLISGNIGPQGDGYLAEKSMNVKQASQYHLPQILAFTQEYVDLVTAMTINYIDEAVGIVKAAEMAQVPIVISFTVETDGRLPSGETLQEAIEKTDELTQGYPLHYMINCAHPEHFEHVLSNEHNWKNRIRGIRANASTKSHAELDESDTLDMGDKCLLAESYVRLKGLLPELSIIGGCCGTDHTHLEEVCKHILI